MRDDERGRTGGRLAFPALTRRPPIRRRGKDDRGDVSQPAPASAARGVDGVLRAAQPVDLCIRAGRTARLNKSSGIAFFSQLPWRAGRSTRASTEAISANGTRLVAASAFRASRPRMLLQRPADRLLLPLRRDRAPLPARRARPTTSTRHPTTPLTSTRPPRCSDRAGDPRERPGRDGDAGRRRHRGARGDFAHRRRAARARLVHAGAARSPPRRPPLRRDRCHPRRRPVPRHA